MRIMVVLWLLFNVVSLSAAPQIIVGLASKLGSVIGFAKDKASDVSNFARMSAILSELKVIQEDQNDSIQKLYKDFNKTVEGQHYKDAVDSVYTHDVARNHSLIGEFSEIQSKYSGYDGVQRVEEGTVKTYDDFKTWLTTSDEELAAKKIAASQSGDRSQIKQLSEAGRQQQNNKQNADLIELSMQQNNKLGVLTTKAAKDEERRQKSENRLEELQERQKKALSKDYIKNRIEKMQIFY